MKKFKSTDSVVSLVLGLAVVLVIGITIVNYVKTKSQTGSGGEQETEQSTSPVPLPATHAVQAGESLWSIAQKYYGSGYNWVDIVQENGLKNPNVVEIGQELTIPSVTPKTVTGQAISAASVSEKAKDASYTVVKGDYLWDIAEKEYGTGYRWVDIARANNLANPNIIHAGNVLVLP